MARPRLQDYMGLITQKALATWRKLPPQHRNWIDVDDLIQDGVLFARSKVLPRYRPHRAKFSTYLTTSLENFYRNVLFELFTAKRNKCGVVSVTSVQYKLKQVDHTEQELQALQGLTRIMANASPELHGYLCQWLFECGRLRHSGAKFEVARDELLVLAERSGFNRSDMDYLLRNESWRRSMLPVLPMNPVK